MLPAQLSDEALVAQVARGDAEALETLYERYASIVLGVRLRIVEDRGTAEDVMQETFWRTWQNTAAFQSQKGSISGWLLRIARNLAIDAYRRRRVRPQAVTEAVGAESLMDQMPDSVMDIPYQVQSNIEAGQVRSALQALPPEQRQAIELAYFSGMTRQEIAQATGAALDTIHTRARLGLKKLRQELERVQVDG